MVKKPEVYKSRKNLNYIKRFPCFVCGATPVDADHFKTKGAGGGDNLGNLNALCRSCHIERHSIGIRQFWERYHSVITEARKRHGLPILKVKWEFN
jgi:5-methylcytosine-specific restriction endonuclease McrA